VLQIHYAKNIETIKVDNTEMEYNLNTDLNIDKIRDEFNSVVIDIVEDVNLELVWLTRTVERNTLHSKLFEDICFIFLILKFCDENEGKEIAIYTSRYAVYSVLKNGACISRRDLIKFGLQYAYSSIKYCFYNISFVIRFIMRTLVTHRTAKQINDGSYVIQTWVNDSNIVDGQYVEQYFKGLKDYYEKKSCNIVLWCIIYSSKNYSKLVKSLGRLISPVFIYDYLKLSDLPKLIKMGRTKSNFHSMLSSKVIQKADVTKVFKYYLRFETLEEADLTYIFATKLKSNKNLTFIVNHENMIVEKALVLGLDKPNSTNSTNSTNRVIGCFHSSKPKNLLCLDYHSKREFLLSPKPNTILFNSNVYKHYYLKNFGESHIDFVSGYAFKQQGSKALSPDFKTAELSNAKVLVLLPGSYCDAKFLLDMIIKIKGIRFIIRMHPMVDVAALINTSNEFELDKNKSLYKSLSGSNIVISFYSAAALEAGLIGKSIGLVYNPKTLLLDPFNDAGDFDYQLISNFVELSAFLKNKDNSEVQQMNKEFYLLNDANLESYL